ncbi:MAG: glycosyltransferase family 2 protein [Chloroflexota bacterium]
MSHTEYMRNLSLSVIICAYTEDRWDDLSAAVESVRAQGRPPMEIIVVIDHNPPLAQRARMALPGAVVIENREARGLSGARNTGIAAAKGDVVAFLDDDAIAAPDWLNRLTAGYADPLVHGVGGAIESAWSAGRPRWFPKEFDWVVGCTYRGMPRHASPVRNMIGANMSFRREVFAVVGGFRNGMGRLGTRPLGCEETELCIRVRKHWPRTILLYEPRALVRHRVPAHRARWAYFRARCYSEGLSKAQVSEFVGAKDGLESERHYTFSTLPRGVVRGLADTMKGDLTGLGRAGAIITGLAVTSAGYLAGKASKRLARRKLGARSRFTNQGRYSENQVAGDADGPWMPEQA